MTLDPADICDLRERLRFMHRFGLSWRQIADEFFRGVKFGTLQRIAGGGYLPQDRKILRALGLIQRRKRSQIEKRISGMVRNTRKEVFGWTKK